MNTLIEYLHSTNGLEHGLFNRPPAAYSTIYCRGWNPGNATPLRNGFFHPVNTKKHIGARVIGLFKSGPPLTVAGRITLVVIDSFYRKIFARSLPHIGNEVFKRLPPLANLYAPATIVVKFFVGWIRASLSHSHPYGVFGRIGTAMNSKSLCVSFGPNTTARQRPSVFEGGCRNQFGLATLTETIPARPPCFSVFPARYNRKSSKFLAGYVKKIVRFPVQAACFCSAFHKTVRTNNFFLPTFTLTEPLRLPKPIVFCSFDHGKFSEFLAYEIKRICHVCFPPGKYRMFHNNIVSQQIQLLSDMRQHKRKVKKDSGNGPKMATRTAISTRKFPEKDMVPPDYKRLVHHTTTGAVNKEKRRHQ